MQFDINVLVQSGQTFVKCPFRMICVLDRCIARLIGLVRRMLREYSNETIDKTALNKMKDELSEIASTENVLEIHNRICQLRGQ